jgi:transcriptional regulator GlxA family with amidase domain
MEQHLTSSSSRIRRARLRPPQIVQRLDAFLLEHLDEPICMAQLCHATGVSERSLRNACHAVCGTSPKRYLTRRRLEAVRTALEHARPGQATVTRIATEYGFFELGRFAGIYTSVFGEHPSDTLRSGTRVAASTRLESRVA